MLRLASCLKFFIKKFTMSLANPDFEQVVEDAVPLSPAIFTPQPMDPQLLASHYFENHAAYRDEFFSKAARQESPEFHEKMEAKLWSGSRQLGFKVFRGGAKTTLLRIFAGKRIAYGISRTILCVSNSSENAERTVDWLKKQVKGNVKWATFYGLKASEEKWASSEIEIHHTLLNCRIRVIAVGIHGQIRGINIDDYRPDLILVDDADDEDTTATPEQCKKHVKLFFGAIVRTLAPRSENPYAMIAVLQTPLAANDIIDTCANDPMWDVTSVSCFDADGKSTWEARFPAVDLLAEKAAMIAKRLLSVWLREMEVLISGDEGNDFDPLWLKRYTTLPEKIDEICIAIDPASSASARADDNAIVMWAKANGLYYLITFAAERGQTHIDTSNHLFSTFYPLARTLLKGRSPIVAIETIGYQTNLKAQIDADMRKHGVFFSVVAVKDRRAKRDRILQSFKGASYAGLVLCQDHHDKFIEQYERYNAGIAHDDVIDASAMALFQLNPHATNYAKLHVGGVPRKFASIPVNRHTTRLFGPLVSQSNA